jgi:hypothetical protein
LLKITLNGIRGNIGLNNNKKRLRKNKKLVTQSF